MSVATISCPTCKKHNLVFWGIGEFLICDDCFRNSRYPLGLGREEVLQKNKRILISPIQAEDGSWTMNNRLEFKDLSRILDGCMQQVDSKPFRVTKISISQDALISLLGLAEALIPDPLLEPQFQSLLIEIQQVEDFILRLNYRKEQLISELIELEPKKIASRKTEQIITNEWVTPTEKKYEKKKNKIANIEKRVFEGQKRTLEIREKINGMLRDHSSTFQNSVLKRLRRIVSSRCFYPPLLGDLLQSKSETNSIGTYSDALKSYPALSEAEQETELFEGAPFQIDPDVPVKFVSWKLLETKHCLWDDLIRHYTNLTKIRREEYDADRLKFIYDFTPSVIFVGKAAFEGYVVFCFCEKGR